MAGKLSTRLEAALRIRDAAVRKIRAAGQFEEMRGFGLVMNWDGEGLEISYRTPFQKIPPPKDEATRRTIAARHPSANLPYGLDIWDMEGRGKVLNVEWDISGNARIIGFRRGDWEAKVLAWGSGEVAKDTG